MRHKFKAHQMYFLDGDNPCVFRVDHVVHKNKSLRLTLLAAAKNEYIRLIGHGTALVEKFKYFPLKEITRKDLPLYVSFGYITNEFTKILRGDNHV